MTNSNCVRGSAVPIAEMINRMAHRIRTFLRPRESLNTPANMAPTAQPANALAAVQPSMAGDRSKRSVRKRIAPAITAVS